MAALEVIRAKRFEVIVLPAAPKRRWAQKHAWRRFAIAGLDCMLLSSGRRASRGRDGKCVPLGLNLRHERAEPPAKSTL